MIKQDNGKLPAAPITEGIWLLVKHGPFSDLEGVAVSVGQDRVLMRIALECRSVLVELEKDMVEAHSTGYAGSRCRLPTTESKRE
jgi:hypothetical protein